MKKGTLAKALTAIGFLALLNTSCKKIERIVPDPVISITTDTISDITQTTAISKCTITSDGYAEITAFGICWNTQQQPTINDNKVNYNADQDSFISLTTKLMNNPKDYLKATDQESFTSSINGLNENTKYYFRAYVTTTSGTIYGNMLSYNTLKPFPANGTIVKDIDNNIYHTIIIGNQVWLQENLKATKYRNGDLITNFTDTTPWSWGSLMNSKTGVYCNYNNDPSLGATYGRLYNWFVVNDPRGISPIGWHVPSQAEYLELFNFLGGNAIAGGKLKETGTAHWLSPNTGATNESGFTLLPSGFRELDATYQCLGINTYLWTSTEPDSKTSFSAAAAVMGYNGQGVCIDWTQKAEGNPIRCVMDK